MVAMTYGSPSNALTPALAATGFALAGWFIAAVTILLVGFALMQMARRNPSLRP